MVLFSCTDSEESVLVVSSPNWQDCTISCVETICPLKGFNTCQLTNFIK